MHNNAIFGREYLQFFGLVVMWLVGLGLWSVDVVPWLLSGELCTYAVAVDPPARRWVLWA